MQKKSTKTAERASWKRRDSVSIPSDKSIICKIAVSIHTLNCTLPACIRFIFSRICNSPSSTPREAAASTPKSRDFASIYQGSSPYFPRAPGAQTRPAELSTLDSRRRVKFQGQQWKKAVGQRWWWRQSDLPKYYPVHQQTNNTHHNGY